MFSVLTILAIIASTCAIKSSECIDAKIPIHIPHERLCSTFYTCYKTELQMLKCPQDLYFDENEYICKSSSEVNCGGRIKDNNGVEEDEYAKKICQSIGTGNVSNPRDCATFFICSNGIPYKMDCPSNLYFNNVTKNCDYYYNVNCCENEGSC